jgi:RimJ/RimL family protein N-acetyltransferase
MLEWLRRSRTLPDDPVTLVEEQDIPADSRNSYVPSVLYGIELHGQRIGDCDLRLGMNEELYYAGNIGYNIQKEYRGHGYAYEACRILFRLARTKYHMEELIITCSPDNLASKKTLREAGRAAAGDRRGAGGPLALPARGDGQGHLPLPAVNPDSTMPPAESGISYGNAIMGSCIA